jgi:hypothetical protein
VLANTLSRRAHAPHQNQDAAVHETAARTRASALSAVAGHSHRPTGAAMCPPRGDVPAAACVIGCRHQCLSTRKAFSGGPRPNITNRLATKDVLEVTKWSLCLVEEARSTDTLSRDDSLVRISVGTGRRRHRRLPDLCRRHVGSRVRRSVRTRRARRQPRQRRVCARSSNVTRAASQSRTRSRTLVDVERRSGLGCRRSRIRFRPVTRPDQRTTELTSTSSS